MPEHDIVKHTKAIVDTVIAPGKNWKHKLGDIAIEICIIVFAISLSLLLERWRENVHDKGIEKKFLTGLRTDLKNDIQQLKSDSASYFNLYKGWNYMRTTGINQTPLDKDSMSFYGNTLINAIEFNPSNSRFEALKSSGQFNVIENDSLQNIILDFYQNKVVMLKLSSSYLTTFKTQQLSPFLSTHMRFDKNGSSNFEQLLAMPQMQNYLYLGNVSIEIMSRYHDAIKESIEIIHKINGQYGEEKQ